MVTATAKKNLYLVSEVDLPTGEKPAKVNDPLPTRRVGPGILSELELSDAEIKALPRGVVRPASADEIEAAEQRVTTGASRTLATELDADRRDAEFERDAEKRTAIANADRAKNDAIAKLDAEHEAAREKERAETATALNKANASGTGAGTSTTAPKPPAPEPKPAAKGSPRR